jgi:hypothetical protein
MSTDPIMSIPLTSRPALEATTPTTRTRAETTTKVDPPTLSETKVKKVNTVNRANTGPLQVKDSVEV